MPRLSRIRPVSRGAFCVLRRSRLLRGRFLARISLLGTVDRLQTSCHLLVRRRACGGSGLEARALLQWEMRNRHEYRKAQHASGALCRFHTVTEEFQTKRDHQRTQGAE